MRPGTNPQRLAVPAIRFSKPIDLEPLIQENAGTQQPTPSERPLIRNVPSRVGGVTEIEAPRRTRSADPEKLAAEDLKAAMRHYLANRLVDAEQDCTVIIAQYPRTQAGREAKQLLALMGR